MPPWIHARGSAIPPPPPPQNDPPPIEPEYEVIEFGQQTYSNQPAIRSNKEKEKKRCDLCGSSVPAVKCMQCVQQNFCYSCDEMYHRHPKRQSHVRREVDTGAPVGEGGGRLPPLPPKGEPPPPPIPPPRRNKRATPRPTPPPPPNLPLGPHPQQRDSVSPKPGFVGSLKRMIGVRPIPSTPHTMDRQNSLPPSASMMNFQDQQIMNGGFQDWTEMQRGHRSGSFSTLNPSHFRPMMQAQSMAQLNCPSCQGHGMWNPWGGGMGGTWASQAALMNQCPPPWDERSDSDSDAGWNRERLRRFSTMSARAPRGYPSDETASHKGGRRRQDFDTLSSRGGRKMDFETMSNRGGRTRDFDTMSHRGGKKNDFDTLTKKKQDFETMSLRGGRRSDLESPSLRSHRKFSEGKVHRRKNYRDSDSSDERESEEEFIPPKGNRKAMSDLEDVQKGRRQSEPPSPIPMQRKDSSLKKQSRRNEKFVDTGRRRSSPVNFKYDSLSGGEEDEKQETTLENGHKANEDGENGISFIDDEAEEEDKEELASIPDSQWECVHCTFINEPGTRVCSVCCKTSTKPKPNKAQNKPKPQSPPTKLEDDMKKLKVEEKKKKEDPPKNLEKAEKIKERRGTLSPDPFPRTHTTSTGTSPPPQSISTQTYEEAGKLKRATSLADYSDWKTPVQRSASRQSLLSDTQSLPATPPRSGSPVHFRQELTRRQSDLYLQRSTRRAGSQPPEYLSTIVQKQVKQGLEMVKLLREAEENQFTAEDLAVALVHCGDSDPIAWLQENWRNMIDTVVTLGTNYGQERKENTVGTISASEAREALQIHNGNVWAAVTECVEQRQKKYTELLSRGNFSREDIVTVLTANHGNLEESYKELNKNQLKPFLMRIWGPPQGVDNNDGDFTKLAHGEAEGRGGKNSEEVSVDLSVDSNYERIQNWLEDYVHTNKFNTSQQISNFGGLKRSVSDWKVNNTTINSSSSSTILKTRRHSDIHRYLTALYNANDKTLLINKHSTSTFNLLNVEKNDSISNKNQPETSSNKGKLSSNDNYNGDIETITIKLNPTIVKREEKNDKQQDFTHSNEESVGSDSSEELTSESESESSDEEETHGNTVKANTQHPGTENPSPNQSELVSAPRNYASSSKQKLSRSESQTSSESFESVHSSVDENQRKHHSADRSKSRLNKNSQNNLLVPASNSDSDFNDYVNISVARENYELLKNQMYSENEVDTSKSPSPSFNWIDFHENSTGNSPNTNNKVLPLKDPVVGRNDESMKENSECISPETSLSTNDSEEEFEEVSSDDEMPFVEETSDIIFIPIKTEDDSDNTNFHSTELAKVEERKTPEGKTSINRENTGSLTVPIRRKRQRQFYAPPKSESDFNDENSMDLSGESLEYNKSKRKSPILPLKPDSNTRLSEGNSDRDVSSIPTDSEKEQFFDVRESTRPVQSNFHSRQAELIELLKKSLTSQDVVEKLVSTLFASALQASVEASILKEQPAPGSRKNSIESETTESQISPDASNLGQDEQVKSIELIVHNHEILVENDSQNIITEEIQEVVHKDLYKSNIEITGNKAVNTNEIFKTKDHSEDILVGSNDAGNVEIITDTAKIINEIIDETISPSVSANESLASPQLEYTKQNLLAGQLETRLEPSSEIVTEILDNQVENNKSNETPKSLSAVKCNSETLKASTDAKDNGAALNILYEANDNSETIKTLNGAKENNEMKKIGSEGKKKREEATVTEALGNSGANQTEGNNKNEMHKSLTEANENIETQKNLTEVKDSNKILKGSNEANDNSKTLSPTALANVNIETPKRFPVSNDHCDLSETSIVPIKNQENTKPMAEQNDIIKKQEHLPEAEKIKETPKGLAGTNLISKKPKALGGKLHTNKIQKVLPVVNHTIKIPKAFAANDKGTPKFLTKANGKFTASTKVGSTFKQAECTTNLKVPADAQIVQNATVTGSIHHVAAIATESEENLTLEKTGNKDISKSQLTPNKLPDIDPQFTRNASYQEKIKEEEELPTYDEHQETYDPEREARRLLAEGLVMTYEQAKIAVQLKELKLDEKQILAAATECSSLDAAVAFLQQECQLCAGKYSAKEMVGMLECEHKCCKDCAVNYFTVQITEKSINDCVCPFCKEPDVLHIDEDKAVNYFSHLDIFLKGIVKENIHELFHRKLRDRTLMQDPNFKWCVKCSSGFIANPTQKRFTCPDCKAVTCAKCMKPWEKEHENMTCEQFKTWLELNDPETQAIAKNLEDNGVTCPKCKVKYLLAKGGCMHLTCPQCKHEFCSGCAKPFLMGRKCHVSVYCEKLGLHSHHPRNCLFYLRDKEPEELEKLLEDNYIDFNRTVDTDLTRTCNIQILKETPEGMVEGTCGYPTLKAGLCRKHYVEWLSRLVRGSGLETISLLDTDDLETVVRRTGRKPPPNPYGTPRPVYRAALLQAKTDLWVPCRRTHYIENLAIRIQKRKVDPVRILDFNEAVQELTRHGKVLPYRPQGMSEYNYRLVLYKVIEEQIPLD